MIAKSEAVGDPGVSGGKRTPVVTPRIVARDDAAAIRTACLTARRALAVSVTGVQQGDIAHLRQDCDDGPGTALPTW
nr:hypothetical protein [Pantoea sp. 1.19]